MAKKEMTIQATPQNKLLGTVSRGLGSLRSGMGSAGDFLIGTAPEEIEDWSYGFSPFKENPSGSRIPIEVRPGREERLIDTLGLPVAEAYGLTKLAGKGIKKGIEKAVSTPVKEGRREFLSKAGKAVAGAALIGTAADSIKSAVKTTTKAISGDTSKWLTKMGTKEIGELVKKTNEVIDAAKFQGPWMAWKHGVLPDVASKESLESGLEKLRQTYKLPESFFEDLIKTNKIEKPEFQTLEQLTKETKKSSGGTIENTTHYRKMI
jgi:hypothetical protein